MSEEKFEVLLREVRGLKERLKTNSAGKEEYPLNKKEFCKRYGKSGSWFQGKIAKGVIPFHKFEGTVYVFPSEYHAAIKAR